MSTTTNRVPSEHTLLRETLTATAALSAGVLTAAVLFSLFFTMGSIGCASDNANEPVGHTKTVEKRTVDTPTEKTTVTETHEKDTKVVR